MGDGTKTVYNSERDPITKMGKKLVAARDLPAGTVLTTADIAMKCPADGGLPAYHFEELVGRKLARPLGEDENITFDCVAG